MPRPTGLASLAFVVCSVSVAAPAAGGVVLLPRRTCEVPSDHYPVPGDHNSVNLDGIHGTASRNEKGQVIQLRILDCDGDGTPELFIPTSHARSRGTPAVPARFGFRSLCGDGEQPTEVSFTFSQGGPEAKWTAFDSDGNLVDTAHSTVSGTPQKVTLEHPGGILSVEVVGIRICIERICYRCEEDRPRPTDCVAADDYYRAEETASQVDLGPVFILEGKLPNGNGGGLRVEDCNGDGELDVVVAWADNPAAPALISTVVCDGKNPFPAAVSITFSHETPVVTWNALDSVGAIVDTVVSAGSPAPQTITLEHAAGIRGIQVIGTRICIAEICWRCEERGAGLVPPRFRRGDSNDDGKLRISDAIASLGYIFLGTSPPGCNDAADADDDGALTISDGILILNFLFNGGSAPPGSSACGADPTDDSLDCESYSSCLQPL